MPAAALVPPELLDPVVAYFAPQRVILFGSAARGDAGPDSDIDLLVVVDDDTPPEKATLAAGYAARRSYRRAADVIPIRRSVFERPRRGALAMPPAMKTTRYFEEQVLRKRPYLDPAQCHDVVANPLRRIVQDDNRIRHWVRVVDRRDGTTRVLRVVTLDDGETIHNVFFDRDFRDEEP